MSTSAPSSFLKPVHRLQGVDSVRFLMAGTVVLAHLFVAAPTSESHGALHYLHLIEAALLSLINGPAAVIVFFVISGLCIHFPNRQRLLIPSIKGFYSRRLIRICLPLLVALVISHFTGATLTFLDVGIYWSLICEIIYYLIYPLLLRLRRSYTWHRILIASFVTAACVMSLHPTTLLYPAFTNLGNWIVGLPCWLLGCLLAERCEASPEVSRLAIWGLRIGAVLACKAIDVSRFHILHVFGGNLVVGRPWALDAFAFVAYLWLLGELSWFKSRPAPRILEWVGTWSYSLYLMHLVGFWLAERFVHFSSIPDPIAQLLYVSVAALATAYVFFRMVEYPAHRLAILVSRKLTPPRAPVV